MAELQAWSDQHFADLSRLVVLEAPGGSCDLEQTRLQQLNGDPVDEVTWERLQRLIRLWRKLGWTIPDVDAALAALADDPEAEPAITPAVLGRLAAALQVGADLDLPVPVLVSLWSKEMPTEGPDALYHRLFLNKAALPHDDVFVPAKDGSGRS